jgi:hypothetical protein
MEPITAVLRTLVVELTDRDPDCGLQDQMGWLNADCDLVSVPLEPSRP